jgi:DNA-binding protein HU-beta
MAKAASGKAMTKSAIVEHLATTNELTKKQAAQVMDSLVTLAYREAKKGFTIPGLGKLVMADRKARMGRNPQTGEAIKIPARRVVRFRIGKQAKDAILTGKLPGNGNGKSAAKKKKR